VFYILEENTPVYCNNGHEWAEWFEKAGDRRIVARDEIGGLLVSTVFLGVDPTASIDSPTPLLFETVIIRQGEVVANRGLYPTWTMAEVGHRRAVLRVRNSSRATGS
jgi:hypothetical protein